MQLSRAWNSLTSGVIIVVVLVLLLLLVGASTAGASPTANNTAATDMGWGRIFQGTTLRFCIVLGSSWQDLVHRVQVVDITDSTAPVTLEQGQGLDQGGPYTVDKVICFNIKNLSEEPTKLQVNLLDQSGAIVGVSETDDNPASNPDADNTTAITPTPVPQPAAEEAAPVVTVVIPDSQVILIPARVDGVTAIIQPDQATTVTAPAGDVTITIPKLAIAETGQLEYRPVTLASAPAPPPRTKLVRIFVLNFYDHLGNTKTVNFLKLITLQVKYTDADLAELTDATALGILAYNATNAAWVSLPTRVDLVNKTLTAQVGHLSSFAVGATIPALPEVGDVAPSSAFLLAVALGGVVLVIAGGYFLMASRRQRSK